MSSIKELYEELKTMVGKEEVDRKLRNWLMNYRRNLKKPAITAGKKKFQKECQEVLAHLNSLMDTRYTLTDTYATMIVYWLKLGKTVSDFKIVHYKKYAQWYNNDDMRQYIRPSTLYRKSNFDQYLQSYYADQAHKPGQGESGSTKPLPEVKQADSPERHKELMKKFEGVKKRQLENRKEEDDRLRKREKHRYNVLDQIKRLEKEKDMKEIIGDK